MHGIIGKFILQIPNSSAGAAGWTDADQISDHETESMLLVKIGEQNQGPPDAGVPQGICHREGIRKYCATQLRHGEKNWHRILRNYLGQDRTKLHQRGASKNQVLVAWLGKTKDL